MGGAGPSLSFFLGSEPVGDGLRGTILAPLRLDFAAQFIIVVTKNF